MAFTWGQLQLKSSNQPAWAQVCYTWLVDTADSSDTGYLIPNCVAIATATKPSPDGSNLVYMSTLLLIHTPAEPAIQTTPHTSRCVCLHTYNGRT